MNKLNLNGPISQIVFSGKYESVRVCKALASVGIKNIGSLCMITKKELHSVDQIGKVTVHIIEKGLEDAGLRLGMSRKELEEYQSNPNKDELSFDSFTEAIQHMLNVIMSSAPSQEGNPDEQNNVIKIPVLVFRLV